MAVVGEVEEVGEEVGEEEEGEGNDCSRLTITVLRGFSPVY